MRRGRSGRRLSPSAPDARYMLRWIDRLVEVAKSEPQRFPDDAVRDAVERVPEGRAQYDYLRRLRRPIEELGNVSAIGVVGSDVYDKLLVLRALKPYFPDCVFFTTDLDDSLE